MPSTNRQSSIRSIVAAAALLTAPSMLKSVVADAWNLTDTYQGKEFINQFDYWGDVNASTPDPTNGLVQYLGRTAATAQNITYVDSAGLFNMRVDTTEVQLSGRPSARITSQKTFEDGIFVINVTHVPTGCSVWPAFWLVAPDTKAYPLGGEIDILENANDQFAGTLTSLHTANNCVIDKSKQMQTGVTSYTNCTVDYTTGNNGCRVESNGTSAATWGSSFNSAGGGLFATERSLGSAGNGIRVWYWPQSQIPADLRAGSNSVDPSGWGTPSVDFPVADGCHSDFSAMSFVFDITLCGDWAANTYNASGCAAQFPACSFQVGYNGSSYRNAYWQVADLRVFGSGGGNTNAAISPNTNTASSSTSSSAGASLVQSLSPVLALAATAFSALLAITFI